MPSIKFTQTGCSQLLGRLWWIKINNFVWACNHTKWLQTNFSSDRQKAIRQRIKMHWLLSSVCRWKKKTLCEYLFDFNKWPLIRQWAIHTHGHKCKQNTQHKYTHIWWKHCLINCTSSTKTDRGPDSHLHNSADKNLNHCSVFVLCRSWLTYHRVTAPSCTLKKPNQD